MLTDGMADGAKRSLGPSIRQGGEWYSSSSVPSLKAEAELLRLSLDKGLGVRLSGKKEK